MKTVWCIVSVLAFACSAPVQDTDVDSGTNTIVSVCTDADPSDRFPSTSVDNATFVCSDSGCTVTLPDSVPGRQNDRLTAHSDVVITPGNEPFEYIISSSQGVHAVNLGIYTALHIGDDGLIWWSLDGTLGGMDPTGQVLQRCDAPQSLDRVAAVTRIAQVLWVSGVNEDNRGELWKLTESEWQEQPTSVAVEGFEPYRERQVIALAYGYAEVHDPAVDEGVQIGGSDDDFSAAAICPDNSYWVGGQTGMYMYCTSDHQCERTTEGDYPFQSTSYGCDSDNRLWWFDPGTQFDSPITIGTVTREGVRGETSLDDGIRHRRSQAGRTWEVLNGD